MKEGTTDLISGADPHADMHTYDVLVSVVSYWLSRCNSKISTSTRALAGTSIILLMCSRAKANASRSPRPHTVWSSKMAAVGWVRVEKKVITIYLTQCRKPFPCNHCSLAEDGSPLPCESQAVSLIYLHEPSFSQGSLAVKA